jgi:glycosyltransferase involved in cell wall biosynthesis
MSMKMKLLIFSNTDWYLYNYRVPIDSRLGDDFESIMVSPDGKFSEKIEASGFKWRNIVMSRSGLNIFKEIGTIRSMIKILKEEKPYLIHNFTMKGNINGSLAARFAGVRVVNSITGLGYVYASDDLKAKILRPFANIGYKITLAKGKTIFQNPIDMESFIKKGLVKRENCKLIRSSGVDVNLFVPTAFPEPSFKVVFAGRLLWTKGVGELVEAAREVKALKPEIEIVLAGVPDPGNPATITEKEMKDWQDEGIVEFLGFHSDMAGLLADAHVACFPSKHTEGTPKFLVEAAASGRPIITTDNRGCIEVYNGKNGFLVPKGDAKALAQSILELANNRDLLEEMGKESRKLAVEEFSVDLVASETAEVYRSFED